MLQCFVKLVYSQTLGWLLSSSVAISEMVSVFNILNDSTVFPKDES